MDLPLRELLNVNLVKCSALAATGMLAANRTVVCGTLVEAALHDGGGDANAGGEIGIEIDAV